MTTYKYTSSKLILPNTITSQNAADTASGVSTYNGTSGTATGLLLDITLTAEVHMNTIAINWDTNAGTYYLYKLEISTLQDENPIYLNFQGASGGGFNILEPPDDELLPAGTRITLRAYNAVSGNTQNGVVFLYLKGKIS